MCEPASIIAGASAVAGLVGQIMTSQSEAAYQEAQSKEYARTAKLNQEAANKEFIEASAQERIAQMQQNDAASSELQSIQRERMEKMGEAVASSNAAGSALNTLYADYYRQEAQKRDVVKQQLDMVGVNADTNIQAYRDKALARGTTQQSYIARAASTPDYLGAAFKIGGAYLDSQDRKSARDSATRKAT